eukprot:g3612.t1
MDSLTSGKSLGSFRIGANRETSTAAIQSLLLKDQSIEKKLLAVGILENCTRLMQTITVPRTVNSYPAPTHAALGQALSNDDAVSVMQFVAATVSMGVNLKFSRIINHSIQQRLKTIARRERQLEDLKDRRLKESKNPEVLYREKRNEEMQTAIKHVQTQNLALKCRIREINEELGHLRLAERDATVTVRRLHDCRDKYSKICDENRELNKIIQELQGRVRVMCQLSKPIRNTMNYLSSPNRGEVTLQMKQKTKSFSVDAVMTGPPSTSSLKEDIFPTLNSVLDGFDAMVLSVGDGGSFISNLTCMMSTLLDAANSRFYHVRYSLSIFPNFIVFASVQESFEFEFEIVTMNSTDSIQLAEKTNLITAMVGDDKTMSIEAPIETHETIRRLLMELIPSEDMQHDAHVILRLSVHRRHKPRNVYSMSEITFIQFNASTNNNRWMQDLEWSGIISALIDISSGNLQRDPELNHPLIHELYRPTNNHRLYLLFVQLQNESNHEKTNLAALNMCHHIIQARNVKASSNALTRATHNKIFQIEKAMGEKDKLISGMTKQREKVQQQKEQLESDINSLRAQITCLREARNQKAKASKSAATKISKEIKKKTPLDRSKGGTRSIDIRKGVVSKRAPMGTTGSDSDSRIPLPKILTLPYENERLPCTDEGQALFSNKSHIKTEVNEISRPSKSKLSKLCRDSRK